MFKKKNYIPVQHYEGLVGIPQDFPCKIEITDSVFTITSNKVTVTLPTERIKSFSAVEESKFMLRYHGEAKKTGKSGINKYYLVVDYITQDDQPRMIAFWGTAHEYKKFINLQDMKISIGDYSL